MFSKVVLTIAGAVVLAGGAAPPVPHLDHVVVVVFENRERADVIGNRDAPHFTTFARRYADFTDYTAVAHPSLPNYLALVSGSTQGITTDCTSCVAHGPSIGTLLTRAHLTWGGYAQGYPSSPRFAKKHMPFLYFAGEHGHVHPLQALRPSALPSFALVAPDLCSDAHDCPIGVADAFLARFLPPILRAPRTAVFVVFDEGSSALGGGGHVAAFVAGTAVARGSVFRLPVNHYGLLRTIEDALGLPHLGASARARPITGIWRESSPARSAPDIREKVLRLVDRSRVAHYANGTSGPRILVTLVRYPTRGHAPFPLIVFAHGFATTPARYTALLDSWTRAGYVVAAPVFPVESSTAPGGPDERDLVNQPADVSFVISRLLAEHGLVDPTRIAVAGHSDGAETAFSVAYDRRFLDRRVRAAVILSGAAFPGLRVRAAAGSPALLAIQGTQDTTNAPQLTRQLFDAVARPKYLLWLNGQGHMAPYTTEARVRALVVRATIGFLDRYLRGGRPRPLLPRGTAGATLVSDP